MLQNVLDTRFRRRINNDIENVVSRPRLIPPCRTVSGDATFESMGMHKCNRITYAVKGGKAAVIHVLHFSRQMRVFFTRVVLFIFRVQTQSQFCECTCFIFFFSAVKARKNFSYVFSNKYITSNICICINIYIKYIFSKYICSSWLSNYFYFLYRLTSSHSRIKLDSFQQ